MPNELTQLPDLTKAQKTAGNIVFGAGIVLLGGFLLLCGLKVVPIPLAIACVPSVLLVLGAIFLVNGFIQTNSVLIWCAVVLIVCALVSVIVGATSLSYKRLYPLYIASPGLASVCTALYTRRFADNFKAAVFFVLLSGIFFLNSFGLTKIAVTIPLLLIFFGLVIIYLSARYKKESLD